MDINSNKHDPISIDFFNKINDEYNVEFIFCSNMCGYYNLDEFFNIGFKGKFAKRCELNLMKYFIDIEGVRGYLITKYLKSHGQKYDDYIIFDDEKKNYNESFEQSKIIYTSYDNGITYKNMIDTYEKIKDWEKK